MKLMIHALYPVLVEFLPIPFEFLKTCKSVYSQRKKFRISLLSNRQLNKDILTKYRFHKLILSEDNNITTHDLKHLSGIHTLILRKNRQLTNFGLSYLTNIIILRLPQCDSITDDGIEHIENVK